MRLSVLSGAVLLARGPLVFSRPLSAQQEIRDLSLPPALQPFDIASAFSTDSETTTPNPTLNSDTPDTPVKDESEVPANSGTSPALPRLNLPTYLDTSFRTSLPPSFLSDISTNLPSQSPTGDPKTIPYNDPTNMPPLELAATISNVLDSSFARLRGSGYCLYEILWSGRASNPSNNQIQFKLTYCGEAQPWGHFETAFCNAKAGFALYAPTKSAIYSIENHVDDRCLVIDGICSDMGYMLMSLQPTWDKMVAEKFSQMKVVSDGMIIYTLQDLKYFGQLNGLFRPT